jgi:hypothetical protein
MKPSYLLLCSTLVTGLGLLASSGSAIAGNGPDPSRLPPCQSVDVKDACRLPVKNGQFDSLDGWERPNGLPSLGQDERGNTYAALYVGAELSQPVFAHFGAAPQDVAYALRFRVRADRSAGKVRAMLSMSDGGGNRAVPLGETTTTAYAGDWSTVELLVNGKMFAAPEHVLLKIGNEGGDVVQVDDVTLLRVQGVEAIGRQ